MSKSSSSLSSSTSKKKTSSTSSASNKKEILQISPDLGERFSIFLNNTVPLDVVISTVVPLLICHDTLGIIAQINNEGRRLSHEKILWSICCKDRGWLKEFQSKVEFRNAHCGLNAREIQRRCDYTILKNPLLHYYHPKDLYKTRHVDICFQCQAVGTNRINRNYYAFIANVRVCKSCYVTGRTSNDMSNRPIEYNVISQKDAQKSYLVTKPMLDKICAGTATLTMGSKSNIYSERLAQQYGWERFGGEQQFLAEVIKRQSAADKKAKQKSSSSSSSSSSSGSSKKRKKTAHGGFSRPDRNYQYSNANQLTHLLKSGCTDSDPPVFNMYRLEGESVDGLSFTAGSNVYNLTGSNNTFSISFTSGSQPIATVNDCVRIGGLE